MKQSCGKCKYYRVLYRSSIPYIAMAACTWKSAANKVPTAIKNGKCPSTTAKSGATCKCFFTKEIKE